MDTQIKNNKDVVVADINKIIINQYYIGERVTSDDGYIGTIRYQGKVDGFEGNWYGIEWDDPKRGKHQGTVKGKKYFECVNKGSGSFMKHEKLIKGTTFMNAIHSKFNQKIENYDDLYVNSTKENVKIQIQMIGMDQTREKQKNLISQTFLSGCGLPISEIDDHPLIYNNLKNLVDLNLSNCLINNWSQAIKLLKQLPNLNRLHLSNNRLDFQLDQFKKTINDEIITNVKELITNNINLSNWSTIKFLCKYLFKNVQLLCLSSNSITNTNTETSIETIKELQFEDEIVFSNLLSLDLANNNLKSFKDIISIGKLPNLKELNLNNNQISEIELPLQNNNKTNLFPKLNRIYLSNNKINDWKYVDILDSLQSLEELSFRDNPIITSLESKQQQKEKEEEEEEEEEDYTLVINNYINKEHNNNTTKTIYLNRLNIIPRISNIKKLNLSQITSIERKDAELYFLYENYDSSNKLNNSKKLNYLISIHGEPLYTKLSLSQNNDNNK